MADLLNPMSWRDREYDNLLEDDSDYNLRSNATKDSEESTEVVFGHSSQK